MLVKFRLFWAKKRRFFSIFIFFKNVFSEIYFWFHNLQFYTPTAPQGGGRGPTARLQGGGPLPGGMDLYIIKI